MEIQSKKENDELVIGLIGRLDTTTAPQLEAEAGNLLQDVRSLKLDFSGLEYLSSAGLRVLLTLQKRMTAQGSMVITNVCSEIQEVFDITGFSDILTIE